MRSAFLVIFFLLAKNLSIGQNTIGIPEITNYSKDIYNAGTQNRGIVQDRNGIVYFANYEGLVSFDGTYWKTYPLPNKTVVRSVAIGKDDKIYAGGQDDFGYFAPDLNGKLVYTSLKPLLSEKNYSFTDIWNIIPFGNDIFFRSREKIFQLNNNSITAYPASSEWSFLGLSNNVLIAQDGRDRLLKFGNGMWTPFIRKSSLPASFLVTCVFPIGSDSSFLATVNTGFYVLHGDTISNFRFHGSDPFQNQRILTAISVKRDWIAVGTNLDGCFIINKKGEVIQNISRKEGLQNNNILYLFLDNKNNLWLGLDNGIDFIAYNNAIKHIYPEKLNEGLGYTSIIYKNDLYVGTSNGLYSIPVTGKKDLSYTIGEFRSVPDTKGSTWGLCEINGSLLLGHHDGAFEVKEGRIVPINRNTAYWTFLPFYNILPSSLVVAGNDLGLDLVSFENGRFVSRGNLPGFSESSQFISIDNNNNVWVAHPYRGVYRLDFNDLSNTKVKLYTDRNGLPSSLKNHLFKVKSRIVVATEKGIYEYNDRMDRFEASGYFRDFFGDHNIRLLREDSDGNIWFIEERNLGVIDFSGPRPQIIYFPELNGKMVSDFEFVYPYNRYNVFVGAEKGFYHINFEEYKKNTYQIEVRIRSVKAFRKTDSLLFGGYYGDVNAVLKQPAGYLPMIANSWNSLHFEYSSPLYEAQNSVEYSYFLRGFDKEWSDWSKRTEKEYTNLPAGTYNFEIKAKSNLGNESMIESFSFSVLPPWYKTNWAYFIYALLFVIIIFQLYQWQRKIFMNQQKKHEEDQKQLQYLHQLEMEKSDKEIVKLKNEKLQAEIDHKNKELASAAMHLVQKGDLLADIREEVGHLKKGVNGNSSADEFKKIQRILNEENTIDKDWEQFASHFDTVHSDFLRILKLHFPNLSAHELKLCAYLRMNLSSKEIAQLESISVRGVEISRYRLRKKLGIHTEINLFDFLMNFPVSKSDH